MIVATLVPNNYFAPWEFVESLLSLNGWYQIIRTQGPLISYNRNLILDTAKKLNDSVLMIDSDIVFKKEDVKKMAGLLNTYDVVTGVYAMGNEPHKPAIFNEKGEGGWEYRDLESGIFEIELCGAGFLGISKKVIENIEEKAFNPLPETNGSEDVSFCKRVRNKGYKIYCDSDLLVGHIRNKICFPMK